MKIQTTRGRLLASTMICGAMALAVSSPALAQTAPADAGPTEVEGIVVTGSRIVRQDYVANSPIATVTGEQAVANADVTLDTYLNTLPQVNPAGTTSSNNPGNNGQANIDLRGLGSNRNIVLVDGRRAMVSANTLVVDVNTIPQALIQNIEVITGGAGATYGADAIAGAVNIILKKDFEGVDIRANYSNSTEYWDAEEYQVSGVVGGNFADGKGNAVLGFDRSFRQPLIKSQRPFSQNATSTTSFLPEGALFWANSNPIPQSAIDTLFATYGVDAADVNGAGSGTLGFNMDGTLFYKGVFNSPLDVQNYRYPIDGSVNQNLYPDLYSYNFDFVNLLVLPLDRYSFMSKINYETDNGVEFFANIGWTEYTSATALAPTPFPTVNTRNGADAGADDVISDLVVAGNQISQQLVIPVTNPFIPDDLAFLLASRTGDNPALVGSGANEPFTMRQRTLGLGLRQSNYENTVVQFLGGIRAPLGDSGWELEATVQEGRTEIDENQTGNLDTQRLQAMIEADDGGASICEGGFNIFGRNPISAECADYLESTTTLSTSMKQQIAQAFVRGPVYELPAGKIEAVFGAEYRSFEYDFDPGSASGPISGFNTQNPDAGNNAFYDLFGEMLIPVVRDMPYAQSLDVTLGYRYSWSEFTDEISGRKVGPRGSPAWKVDLNWQVIDPLRIRASYQRSVREPNFSELFAGGGSAPQYFDPCSVTSQFRQNDPDDSHRQLCLDAGLIGGISPAQIDTYVQTPGNQIGIDLDGSTDLQPEKGETLTLGAVINSWSDNPWMSRFRASVDYYKIKITDALLTPTPNQMVAQCYNYYGTNPDLDSTTANCFNLLRFGGDILWIYDYAHTDDGVFVPTNGGHQETSGIDFQVDWGFDMDQLGMDNLGSMRFNALLTHILEFKQQDPIEGVPELDFVGTVSYFGAGLGTSFPDWKANVTATWDIDPFEFNVRGRYISAMENRLNIEFPGETEFTGTDAVWYWDVAGAYDVNDNLELRLGVNNVFDKEAETYNPNVQSGTDPSTYDVIGRRVFGGLRLKF
ncbi:MAG TPA: TonB-dependent receptor [Caulobacteraceae bacterium]